MAGRSAASSRLFGTTFHPRILLLGIRFSFNTLWLLFESSAIGLDLAVVAHYHRRKECYTMVTLLMSLLCGFSVNYERLAELEFKEQGPRGHLASNNQIVKELRGKNSFTRMIDAAVRCTAASFFSLDIVEAKKLLSDRFVLIEPDWSPGKFIIPYDLPIVLEYDRSGAFVRSKSDLVRIRSFLWNRNKIEHLQGSWEVVDFHFYLQGFIPYVVLSSHGRVLVENDLIFVDRRLPIPALFAISESSGKLEMNVSDELVLQKGAKDRKWSSRNLVVTIQRDRAIFAPKGDRCCTKLTFLVRPRD